MLTYCLKCKENTRNLDTKMKKTKNSRSMLLSKCAERGSKKSKFIKEQEPKGLLNILGIKTPLIKILLLNVLF